MRVRDRLSWDLQHAKVINKLEHQKSLLLEEKGYLKRVDKFLIAKFDAMEAQMNKDCVVATARLQTKLEDMEFQNCECDVFRFMRDGISAKHSTKDFPKGVSPLPFLKYSKHLLPNEEDD